MDNRTKVVGWVRVETTQTVHTVRDRCVSHWLGSCIGDQETSGLWDKLMAVQPSNFRELAAVYLALKSFRNVIQGKAVTVLSDNITTCAYLNHLGGPVPFFLVHICIVFIYNFHPIVLHKKQTFSCFPLFVVSVTFSNQ